MYWELHTKTNFSFLQGASHPDEIIRQAAEIGLAGIAITDEASVAGVVRAHVTAKELGIKLIIGAEIVPTDSLPVVLWATDRASYGHLCRLITKGRRRSQKGSYLLTLQDIAEYSQGLLAGVIPQAREGRSILHDLQQYRSIFGQRGYLLGEILLGPNDRRQIEWLQSLSRRSRLPLLAAGQVFYHHPSRAALSDILMAIRLGTTVEALGERRFINAQRYLKSFEEINASWLRYPDAVARTEEVASLCHFSLDDLRYEYPQELSPPGETPFAYLQRLTWEGAKKRYPQGVPEKISRLLEHELKLIHELHYEPYFLTVWDLVRFARSRGIICQGRGSAANSAVCYCLGITAVDPERMDLLFERFVSRERNEAPDIDVDFEHQRREEIIQYIYQKYGRERAGMTAEVITYRPRSAVRDVGKALGFSLREVDRIAKQIERFHEEPDLLERCREAGIDTNRLATRYLVEWATTLVGFPRHLSQHTGGMVITQGPLCELVPIENGAMPDRTVIQWNKDDLDEMGILKIDCLCLGMLTAIRRTFDAVSKHYGQKLTLASIPEGDPSVYAMIRRADTMGVFQIESRAQMSMLPRLQPRCFYDLVIEVAIVRPGPIQGNMVHPYLRRRNGEEPITYPNEAIRQVLGKTLGVPLFQEQAMRLAIVAAGFTPGEADQLRRAMGAWRRPGLIDAFRRKLVNGMLAKGFTPEYAEAIFQQIRGFGDYGFPESHAASFALLVYVSAWLKYHYQAAFTVGLLNSQPMGFYAPAQLIADARRHGIEVRPVDINFSDWETDLEDINVVPESRRENITSDQHSHKNACSPMQHAESLPHPQSSGDENAQWHSSPIPNDSLNSESHHSLPESSLLPVKAIRLGFHMVNGLREADVEKILKARKDGRFTSILDLVQRTGLTQATIIRLARADTFGSLGLGRREALWQASAIPTTDPPPLFQRKAPSGSATTPADLGFGYSHEEKCSPPKMLVTEEVVADYAMLGFSLKSHPLRLLRKELNKLEVIPAERLAEIPDGHPVRVAGMVLVRQRPSTARGITFVTLEDETGIVNLIVRPDVWQRWRSAALNATLLFVVGRLQKQNGVTHVVAIRLEDLSQKLSGLKSASRDFC
ncbi:MAG: error-prone DNA polymerase [Thermogutta sp.]